MDIGAAVDRGRVRALQLRLWEEDFDLDDERREFAHALIEGLTPQEAARRARPGITDRQARNLAHRLLGERRADGGRGDPELHRYLTWRRSQIAARAEIREDELAAKWRRVYDMGVGDVPVLRTLDVRGGEGQAPTSAEELRFEPSLPAANQALEGLRRLAGLGKDLEPTRISATASATSVAATGFEVLAQLPREKRDALERLLAEIGGATDAPGGGG